MTSNIQTTITISGLCRIVQLQNAAARSVAHAFRHFTGSDGMKKAVSAAVVLSPCSPSVMMSVPQGCPSAMVFGFTAQEIRVEPL